MKTPLALMQQFKITQEELISHFEAYQYMSHNSSEAKMKNISTELRDNIGKFYQKCRENGWYPLRPDKGEMTYMRLKNTPPMDLQPTVYVGDCIMFSCRECPHNKACSIRGKEWVKGINLILEKKLGMKGAEELTDYMQNDFQGGVN